MQQRKGGNGKKDPAAAATTTTTTTTQIQRTYVRYQIMCKIQQKKYVPAAFVAFCPCESFPNPIKRIKYFDRKDGEKEKEAE